MSRRRPLTKALFLAIAVVGLVAALAAPAAAHAVLIDTSPTAGQILLKPPTEVRIRFNENVEVSLGAVRLFSSTGKRIDTGAPTKPSADVVEVPLRTKLPGGAYIVTWRVISADSHPVQGSFTFQVGTNANATAPSVQALAGNLLRKNTGSEVVGAIYGVARWIVFLGLALLIGVGAFVMFLWPRGVASRRVRLLAWAGWTALFVATAASLLLEGPYGAGLDLSAAWKPSVIGDVLATHFGHVLSARLVLLVLAFPLLVVWFRRRDDETPTPRARWRSSAVVLAAAILLTVSLAGHAEVGSYSRIALVADWVHVASMAVWLGGLAVLVVAVLAPRNLEEQRRVVPRFSRLGLVCICALIASGAYATWRQVGGFEAFKRTDYGQLLVIKLAIFALLLLFATRSRDITNYLFGQPMLEPARPPVPVIAGGADDTPAGSVPTGTPVMADDDSDDAAEEIDEEIDEDFDRRVLRRTVGFEVGLALVILAVSAMLVNALPARTALETLAFAGGSSDVTLKSDRVWVDVTIAPGVNGPNAVHVNTLLASGGTTTPLDLELTLDLPSKGIAPLKVPLIHAGPGHYLSTGFVIPLAGTWRVTARVLVSRLDEETVVGTITIR